MDKETEAKVRQLAIWPLLEVWMQSPGFDDGLPSIPYLDENGGKLSEKEFYHLLAFAYKLGLYDEEELKEPCLAELKRYREEHGKSADE